jgi:hypothetical protein
MVLVSCDWIQRAPWPSEEDKDGENHGTTVFLAVLPHSQIGSVLRKRRPILHISVPRQQGEKVKSIGRKRRVS